MSDQRYGQLIADLKAEYRPQREWGEGRGLNLVIGHFLVGVAGGTWLLSWLWGVGPGMVVAFLLGGAGGLAHLAYLGRPGRAFKMMRHWRTSWISRGFLGLSAFLAGNVLYLPSELLGAHSPLAGLGLVLALVGCVTIIGYMGFCYTASKAVPFWNSPLHPVLYIAYAARGGLATLLVVAALGGGGSTEALLQPWIGVTAIVGLFFALEIQGALAGGNASARRSVHDLLAGRLALAFYGGTLVLGLAVPALLLSLPASHAATTMALVGLASVAGDFFMKLSTVKAGVYLQLRPPTRQRAAR